MHLQGETKKERANQKTNSLQTSPEDKTFQNCFRVVKTSLTLTLKRGLVKTSTTRSILLKIFNTESKENGI